MHCNIDARGKAWRLLMGSGLVVLGLLILIFADVRESKPMLALTILLFAGGAFAIFEGWAGWCVLRALGFRTRI